uniref:response regulator n=1 Tax=Aliarcobacter sp. TaxID=2321116 RepID=UPI004047B8D7
MENIENLKVLQSIAKDFNILLVEDSKALQKQVVLFLGKFFKNVYVANDGVEGLEFFKENKPDLILTDLTMPRMNGHDMIREIKKIDADIEIIILSAHSDPETLMTSFHIGVSDFIQKPITAPKMINVFLKVLSNIKRKKEQVQSFVKNSIELEKEDVLSFIYESDLKFELINYYKGVPIINSAKILEIENNEVLVKTSYLQLMAIKYEDSTIFDSIDINENVYCKLISINTDNYTAKLKKEKAILPNSKHRSLSKVVPNEFLTSFVVKYDTKTPIKILSISLKEIVFILKETNISLSKHDNVEILLSSENENILLENTIFKKEQKDGGYEITSLIKPKQKTQENLEKYINKREQEILEEFKNLYLYE